MIEQVHTVAYQRPNLAVAICGELNEIQHLRRRIESKHPSAKLSIRERMLRAGNCGRLRCPRVEAVLRNDVAALDHLTADDFIVTTTWGAVFNKADVLALYKQGGRQTRAWEPSDLKVRVYGNTAIVTGTAHVEDVLNGQVRDVHWRFTHAWVNRDGRWLEVAQHDSLIAERNPQIEAEARKVIDAFTVAANKRDLEGLRNAVNFPYIRIASGSVRIFRTREEFISDTPPGAIAEGWHHSTVDSVEFIQSSSDKVHAAVVFSPYKADGTRYATYRTLRIITKQDGHWGT